MPLAQNEATPEPIRRDLEMAVSLFDLMREADKAPLAYRQEYAEGAKSLYQQLPAELKPIVKQQLKQLARPVSATGVTQELPPLPSDDQDWETLTTPPAETEAFQKVPLRISREEHLSRAERTLAPEELMDYLLEEAEELWQAALRNPMVTEDILCDALPRSRSASLMEEVYGEARWYFREKVREAIYTSPACPVSLAKDILRTRELIAFLGQGPRNGAELHRIVSLFSQIEESEYQYLTYWAKRNAPNLFAGREDLLRPTPTKTDPHRHGDEPHRQRGEMGLPRGAGLHGQPGHPA